MKDPVKELESAQIKYAVAINGGYPKGELDTYRLLVKFWQKKVNSKEIPNSSNGVKNEKV